MLASSISCSVCDFHTVTLQAYYLCTTSCSGQCHEGHDHVFLISEYDQLRLLKSQKIPIINYWKQYVKFTVDLKCWTRIYLNTCMINQQHYCGNLPFIVQCFLFLNKILRKPKDQYHELTFQTLAKCAQDTERRQTPTPKKPKKKQKTNKRKKKKIHNCISNLLLLYY